MLIVIHNVQYDVVLGQYRHKFVKHKVQIQEYIYEPNNTLCRSDGFICMAHRNKKTRLELWEQIFRLKGENKVGKGKLADAVLQKNG